MAPAGGCGGDGRGASRGDAASLVDRVRAHADPHPVNATAGERLSAIGLEVAYANGDSITSTAHALAYLNRHARTYPYCHAFCDSDCAGDPHDPSAPSLADSRALRARIVHGRRRDLLLGDVE